MREIRKKKRRIGGWELRHERSDWLSEVRQLGIRTRAKRLAERSEAIRNYELRHERSRFDKLNDHVDTELVEVSRCRGEAIRKLGHERSDWLNAVKQLRIRN